MKIRLKDDIPGQATYNSLPHPLNQELKHFVEDLLNKQWITTSHLEYSSPVVEVRKEDGKLRLCCDNKKLNANTFPDYRPHPPFSDIRDIIDNLGKNQYFSLLGPIKAYQATAHGPRK